MLLIYVLSGVLVTLGLRDLFLGAFHILWACLVFVFQVVPTAVAWLAGR